MRYSNPIVRLIETLAFTPSFINSHTSQPSYNIIVDDSKVDSSELPVVYSFDLKGVRVLVGIELRMGEAGEEKL